MQCELAIEHKSTIHRVKLHFSIFESSSAPALDRGIETLGLNQSAIFDKAMGPAPNASAGVSKGEEPASSNFISFAEDATGGLP